MKLRVLIPLFMMLLISNVSAFEREPNISGSPSGRIYTAWMDTTANSTHLSRSLDKGITWTDQIPNGWTGVDPSVAVDLAGRVYLCILNSRIKCIRSDDHFTSIALMWELGGTKSDKPFVGIGPGDAVYITYAGDSFPPSACAIEANASNIFFVKSVNQGISFTVPIQLTLGTIPNGRCTNAPFVMGPNGEIIVVLNCFVVDVSQNCITQNFLLDHKVYITRSMDGGNTFSAPTEFIVPTWSTNIYMNQEIKARLNLPFPAMLPNGILALIYSCENSGTDIDVCVQTSTDNGVTFSLIRIVNSDLPNSFHFWPTISADNTGLHALWLDTRSPGSLLDLSASKIYQTFRADSKDAGITWINERVVSSMPFTATGDLVSSTSIGIFMSCYKSMCAWSDTTSGTAKIYFDWTIQGLVAR